MLIALAAATLLTASASATRTPSQVTETHGSPARAPSEARFLVEALGRPDARDALARVAYAEAGDQGASGLAVVVYTIINRLIDGRWGRSVAAVVDAPYQFEPVMRAGGDWRRLAPVSPTQEAKVHTIVELALQGRLPDLTGGARYFQNEKIVAGRVAAGAASPDLVAFGGASPSAKIGAHSFFRDVAAKGQGAGGRPHRARARQVSPIFFNATHGMPGEKSEAGSPSAR